MKKSKFLQNSKDLLSRSFNPVKCKTSLRLAGSRLKLLRNKKEVQVKQMKKEIAQLLESGQDRTARIRVEHVIREEKMMAAYDLLEIYCELIVARLPIIESQKNCPIDLKEAIASVIFASPRCGDVPELLDVRKHFTAKYGKDFTTAAIELRPQCGVGRMMVEKLSAAAPDGQTKTKILSAIAEEHNVKWEPTSFEEKDPAPPSDLLSGASTFVESKVNVEPLPSKAEDVQSRPGNNMMHSSPLNVPQQDPRISVGAEKVASAETSSVSPIWQSEASPRGDERDQLFQVNSNTSSLDRQKWNMEFKDASSAAQAAAESAERASIAARAAAELASHDRIRMQSFTESHQSGVYSPKDEGPEMHLNSKSSCEQISEETVNRSSSEHTRLQNEQIDGFKHYSKTDNRFKEDGRGHSEEYSWLASLKSKASIDDDSVEHGVPVVDRHSQNSDVFRDKMSVKKPSFKHGAETSNSWTDKAQNFREDRTGKQHSVRSSSSHSSISDDVNIFANSEVLKSVNDAGDDPFVDIGKGSIHVETSQTSSHSHEYAAVVFDKFDSDSDDHGFGMRPTYDEPEPESHFPSLGQKPPEPLSMNTDIWRPRSNSIKTVDSSSLFFTRESSNLSSKDAPELDNFAPMTFDDSDESSSESNDDMNTKRYGVKDSRDLWTHEESRQSGRSRFEDELNQSIELQKDEGHAGFDKTPLSLSSDEDLKSEEVHWDRNRYGKFNADSQEKLSLGKPSVESNDIGNVSSPENGEGLNFGKLTGGLRHKRYNGLPFLKNQLEASSSVTRETETTAGTTRSNTPPPVECPIASTMSDHKKGTRTPDLPSESDSESSEEEEPIQKSSGHKQKQTYVLSDKKEVRKKSSLGASNPIFGSDSSDLDEDPPEKPITRKSHLQSGISRRTKASPSTPGTNSSSKIHLRSEMLDSDAHMDRKPATSNSGAPKRFESHGRESGKRENYEQPTSTKVTPSPAKSNFWGPPEPRDSAKATAVTKQESKMGLTPEAHDSNTRKPSKFQSLRRNSSQLGNSEQPTQAKVGSIATNSNLRGTQEKPNSGKATSLTKQESKISQKVEETSSPQKKTEASSTAGRPKTGAFNRTSPNDDDSTKRASHVHPKLPDYDTLVQSLRMGRS